MTLDREQVLAYRIAQHGLHRDPGGLDAVLDLGVQHAGADSARLALAARGETAAEALVIAWTFRGAPHLHRPGDLAALAPALWPRSDADAVARLSWDRTRVRRAGMPAVRALREAADGMRAAVTAPMTKGTASTAVTKAIPAGLSLWCRGCQATHVHEQLFRLAALPAGVRLERDATPLTLLPIVGWPGPPDGPNPRGQAKLITGYLRLHGPATPSEVASFLGSTPAEIRAIWPDGLAEVTLEGRTGWLPEDRLAELRDPPPAELVRLLPPSDPYLQARDRPLLVPDKGLHKELWRILGNPGAVLVDGEIAGVWRASKKAKRLETTVREFWRLPGNVRADIEKEAQRMAEVRGVPEAQVRYG
ncbi:MAG: winged helix DNA-binding domain-containing protein [Pseudonocardiaceae bacterium]|nr:winged helix DNA-binding domain-containing protein [Pseudonocardiaceae bacterium]